MPDREFKIKITGDAASLVSSSKQSADALRDTAHEVEESGKKTESHNKHVEEFNLKVGEQRKLLRELGEQFPIAATAARLFMDPLVASISTGILLFSAMKEHLDEVNKALDEQSGKLADSNFLDGIQARHDAIVALRKEMVDYNYELERAVDAESAYNHKIDANTELLNAETTAIEKLNTARRETALAEIDAQEKAGKISAAQATVERYAIGVQGRNAGVNAQAQEHADEIESIKAKLLEMEKLAPGTKQAVEDAEKKAETSAGDVAKAQADLKKNKERQPDLDKAAADAREEADRLAHLDRVQNQQEKGTIGDQIAIWWQGVKLQTVSTESVKKAQDDAALKQLAADKNASAVKDDQGKIDNSNTDKKALDDAKAENKKLIEDFRALVEQLNQKIALFGAQDQGAAAVASEQNRGALTKAVGDLANSPKDIQSVLQAIGMNQQQIIAIVQGGHQNVAGLNAMVQQLANAVQQLARQIQQTKSSIASQRGPNSGG
jgi:hypothetical protein